MNFQELEKFPRLNAGLLFCCEDPVYWPSFSAGLSFIIELLGPFITRSSQPFNVDYLYQQSEDYNPSWL